MKPINVGLLGIGTVGGGTWDVLGRNAGEIRRRAGRAIKITKVADKALHRAKKITGKKAKVVALRTEIEVVGPQPHDLASERLERMSEKQQLADQIGRASCRERV